MKKLKNKKSIPYCFPVGIVQNEKGDLYYIDVFKSMFLIILMPIRIFFPVKLYIMNDKNEKNLAYERYNNKDIKKNIGLYTVFGISLGGVLNAIFSKFAIFSPNASAILKFLYFIVIFSVLNWMIFRRVKVLKLIKLDRSNYVLAKIKFNDIIVIYFIAMIICLFSIYFVLNFDVKNIIDLSYLFIYAFLLPLLTLISFGFVFQYDDLKFVVIKEVKK